MSIDPKQLKLQSEKAKKRVDTPVDLFVQKVQECRELAAWKREALAVEQSWDVQRIGKLLNLTPGSDIRAHIEPKIRELQEENRELRKICAFATSSPAQLYCDDGELQANITPQCVKNMEMLMIDWKRDSIDRIRHMLSERLRIELKYDARAEDIRKQLEEML